MEYLSKLNPQQLEAVTTYDPVVRVVAGAGSGKTRVLTSRIAYLIEKMGVPSAAVLAITFTNKAAREMKKRVNSLLAAEDNAAIVATFHAFCVRFLKQEITLINYPRNFVIVDDDDQVKVVKQIVSELSLPKEIYKPSHVLHAISAWKQVGIKAEQAKQMANGFAGEQTMAKLYESYEAYLWKNGYLDFDDLINRSVEILEQFPHVRLRWQQKFSHILVDEFQDTNDMQYRLLMMLCGEGTNLMVVGDPDQTIYTWRGANVDIMLNLQQDFPAVKDIILNTNYRSTKTILAGANRLIQNNLKRIPKELVTPNEMGPRILYYQAREAESEARWVAEQIRKLKVQNPSLTYSDFAIMYRSNYYSRAMETELVRMKMPYVIFGGIRFFDRQEIKDSIAYLRLLTRNDDSLAFKRIVNEPKRGIGDKGMEQIVAGAKSDNISEFEFLRQHMEIGKRISVEPFYQTFDTVQKKLEDPGIPYATLLDELLEGVGYLAALRVEQENERLENINELKNYFFTLQKTNPSLSLNELLQELALYTSQDEMVDGDFLSLMTVHTAKGLEFPFVFIVGLAEGVFPNRRSVEEREGDGMEEERRLAYVAFTRAMKQLFLSYSLGFNFSSQTWGVPSRFIEEAGQLIEPYFTPTKRSPSGGTTPLHPLATHSTFNKTSVEWHLGDIVEHIAYKEGVVIGIEGEALRIAFQEPFGVKLIARKFSGISKKG